MNATELRWAVVGTEVFRKNKKLLIASELRTAADVIRTHGRARWESEGVAYPAGDRWGRHTIGSALRSTGASFEAYRAMEDSIGGGISLSRWQGSWHRTKGSVIRKLERVARKHEKEVLWI